MANIYNLFKFLEDKEGTETPFMVKFIHSPNELTPDELNIDGNFDLNDTPITSLPDGLEVGDDLFLSRAKITSLPDGLEVGGNLWLENTPLAKKYTKEEIRKMIEDKGGEIKRNIFV